MKDCPSFFPENNYFGGKVNANLIPCSTHADRSSLFDVPSGEIMPQPRIARPVVSKTRVRGRLRAAS